MKTVILLATAAIALPVAAVYPLLGPDVDSQTASEICAPGYARDRRPPQIYTRAVKRWMAWRKGVDPQAYELDHRIPICLGGAAWSLSNLWLQSWPEARRKDRQEAIACRAVCDYGAPLWREQDSFRNWGP